MAPDAPPARRARPAGGYPDFPVSAVYPAYPFDGPAQPDYSLPPGPFRPGDRDPGGQRAGREVPGGPGPSGGQRPGTRRPAGQGPGGQGTGAVEPPDLEREFWGPDEPERRRWRLGRRGRRLAAAGLAIALVSAVAGGVVGGYIVSRSQSAGTTPGYSLGPVPRAPHGRAAGTLAGVAQRVLPSVVMIRVNGGEGTGSGFVIRGGYVVTNNHVVTLDGHSAGAALQVVLGNGKAVPGKLVGRDTYSDIAVIKPQGVTGLPALPLGNSAGLEVGDPVEAFGAPLGLAGTVTSGIVSAVNRPVQPGAGNGPAAPQVYLEAIQTDAPINPGNSGGPLVNAQGQVVGVNAAFDTLGGNMITGQGGSIGLGFAIPVNQARRVATELVRTGHATHSVIGALLNLKYTGTGAQIAGQPSAGSSRPASAESAGRAGGGAGASAGATPPITPGGPAAHAGLHPGDVIVSFGGQQVSSAATLLDAIRARSPGSPVRLAYRRDGAIRHVTLRLGSAPS
ncbi:MAG TPA: trypsin-like peptidase domain-containing protein [Streptosporangiaceae bacterium]|nr:trypsin-like peptidase domain-containing protein [Streptosporangiaceae bacterium]